MVNTQTAYAEKYTLLELMAATIARELIDGETAFVGVVSAYCRDGSKLTHAPRLTIGGRRRSIGASPVVYLLALRIPRLAKSIQHGPMWL